MQLGKEASCCPFNTAENCIFADILSGYLFSILAQQKIFTLRKVPKKQSLTERLELNGPLFYNEPGMKCHFYTSISDKKARGSTGNWYPKLLRQYAVFLVL